ncbi:MAG: hypothetical protein FWG82_06960 [Oscillospiraceae bacterium]|nr:hypothetical protein [Oscillospiraceae bacterium]
MREKSECGKQGKAAVSVHLTESQKSELEAITRDWGIEMATVGRRLILRLLDNKVTLLGLLQKYQAAAADKKITSRPAESRNCRICIRLLREEKQKLNLLADEWFYLPGELARILFELFIMGIIGKNEIWE